MCLKRNRPLWMLISIALHFSCAGCIPNIVMHKITAIEKIIHHDPGNRGIKHLFQSGNVLNAMQCLLASKHVAIVTGFFIPGIQQPETDGPLGAFALARALAAHNKKVTIITDSFCAPALDACYRSIISPFNVSLMLVPSDKRFQNHFMHKLLKTADCLLSIERVGKAHDGSYRTMRSIDITPHTAPLDEFFIAAHNHKIKTIGIGDGGNEIGMGAASSLVKKHIPNGGQICCTIPVDHLIVAGVSNWGGYALAGALCCVLRESNQTALALDECFSSNQEQRAMLANMIEHQCCDGVTLTPSLSVDGLDWKVHEAILDRIRTVIQAD